MYQLLAEQEAGILAKLMLEHNVEVLGRAILRAMYESPDLVPNFREQFQRELDR